MEEYTEQKRSELKSQCNRIVLEYPEAMGIAVLELDCGCLNICGVVVVGDPVGPMKTISARFDGKDGKTPVCLSCDKEKSICSVLIGKG